MITYRLGQKLGFDIGVSDSGVPSIGNNCTLGYGSKVIGGVKIANNCIIGAGSVVTKSVEEEYSRIAGIPAKRLWEVN